MLSFGTAYADNKKDLFDDYGIYTKEMDEQIITVKKEVYTEIYNIKKLMLENISEYPRTCRACRFCS